MNLILILKTRCKQIESTYVEANDSSPQDVYFFKKLLDSDDRKGNEVRLLVF